MQRVASLIALFSGVTLSVAAGLGGTNNTETAQWQRIYERVRTEWAEWGMGTNLDKMGITNVEQFIKNPMIRARFVHPAFGIYWDEIPPPTLTNASAMAGVDAFLATNGWNMHTGSFGPFAWVKHQAPIRGLPWREIQDREFPATTYNGILYVELTGWHYNDIGVAFNPKTNIFPKSILGFKSLGSHWYAWAQRDDGLVMTQVYEGQKVGEPDGAANRSQPAQPATNSTPLSAGSGR